jgi:quercetin dioxygenase-like cupin family protein
LEFTIGDETRVVKAGELFVIPGGVEHSVKVGEQPARALDIFSPVREEYKW